MSVCSRGWNDFGKCESLFFKITGHHTFSPFRRRIYHEEWDARPSVFSMKLKRPGRDERDSNYETVYFTSSLLMRSKPFIMWDFHGRRRAFARAAPPSPIHRDNYKMLPAAATRLTTKGDSSGDEAVHRVQIAVWRTTCKGERIEEYNLYHPVASAVEKLDTCVIMQRDNYVSRDSRAVNVYQEFSFSYVIYAER